MPDPLRSIARQAAANTFPPDFRDITEADLDHAADAVAVATLRHTYRCLVDTAIPSNTGSMDYQHINATFDVLLSSLESEKV